MRQALQKTESVMDSLMGYIWYLDVPFQVLTNADRLISSYSVLDAAEFGDRSSVRRVKILAACYIYNSGLTTALELAFTQHMSRSE